MAVVVLRISIPLARRVLFAALVAASLAAPAAANDPENELAAAETAGSQLLFDYDFDEALKHYARISERFPEHPTGPYNLATTIWTRLAQRSNAARGPSLRSSTPRRSRPAACETARRRWFFALSSR